MWTIHIRWRAIFEPWCWIRGHRWDAILGFHVMDQSRWRCLRCVKDRPAWRHREEIFTSKTVIPIEYRRLWVDYLDADGKVTHSSIVGSNVPNDVGMGDVEFKRTEVLR